MDLKRAQTLTQEMLNTQLDELATVQASQFPNNGFRTSFESFKAWDGKYIDTLDNNEVTYTDRNIRNQLELLANEHLQNPFIGRPLREALRKECPEKYDRYIADADDINLRSLHIPDALKKFLAFIDALIALADEGARPDYRTIRDGVAVMDAMKQNFESEQTDYSQPVTSQQAQTDYYSDKVHNIVSARGRGDALPWYIDDKMAERIDEYTSILGGDRTARYADENTQKIKVLRDDIRALVREHEPFNNYENTKKAYKEIRRDHKERVREAVPMENLLLELIQFVRPIAKELNINLSSTKRFAL